MDAEELYKKHLKLVYHYLLSLCHSPELAEELTQETFLQALQSLDRFKGQSAASTWLCAIAKHVWYQHLRKHKEEAYLEDCAEQGHEIVEWGTPEVLKIIYRLNNPMKEIVYLRLVSDLSYREIGEIMGRPENWVRVNFYRAKQKIVEELKDGKNDGLYDI